ncbi:Hypothetical predicted protein [Cloeon dipterum]|uniref:Uncharacterized protein n=1 Tax=Cloeon dipterum TaxID=197152 RepID=A0A8S1C0D6_9INSE|nr:Hypothetical predicted protein [Cloeon dipterum]
MHIVALFLVALCTAVFAQQQICGCFTPYPQGSVSVGSWKKLNFDRPSDTIHESSQNSNYYSTQHRPTQGYNNHGYGVADPPSPNCGINERVVNNKCRPIYY